MHKFDLDQTTFTTESVVEISSFLQVSPLVFLVMAYNIKICLSYHPIPTTEKTIKLIKNIETEDLQQFNKVGTMVKPKEDFRQDLNVKSLRWYYTLSYTGNNALELFFRRFYA